MDDSSDIPIIIGSDDDDDDIVVIKEEVIPIDIDDEDDIMVVEEKSSLPIKKDTDKTSSLSTKSSSVIEAKSEHAIALDLRVKVVSLSEADSTIEVESSEDSKSLPASVSLEQNNSVSLFDAIFPDTTDQLNKTTDVNLSTNTDFIKTETKSADEFNNTLGVTSDRLSGSSVSSVKGCDTAAKVSVFSYQSGKTVPQSHSESLLNSANSLPQESQVVPVSSCVEPSVFQSTYTQCTTVSSSCTVSINHTVSTSSVYSNKINSSVISHSTASSVISDGGSLQSTSHKASCHKSDESDNGRSSNYLSRSLSSISAESLPPRKRLKHEFQSQVSCPAMSTNSSAYSDQSTCVSCCTYLSGVKVSRCIQGHPTCGVCLEEAVRLVLTGKGKSAVKCLAKSCDVYYPASELRHTLPKMVVDILEDKLDQDYVNYISDMMLPSTSTMDNSTEMTTDGSDAKQNHLTKTESEIIAELSECIDSDEKKESKGEYPGTWSKMDPKSPYEAVPLEPESIEYLEIALRFYETMRFPTADIIKVSRIQNPILWKYFAVKKTEMIQDNDGIEVEERKLFHGTHSNVIDAICRKGFDWRVCGKHGTMFGQGSYFAVDALYSHQYSDKSRLGGRPLSLPKNKRTFPSGLKQATNSNHLFSMLMLPSYPNNVPAHSNLTMYPASANTSSYPVSPAANSNSYPVSVSNSLASNSWGPITTQSSALNLNTSYCVSLLQQYQLIPNSNSPSLVSQSSSYPVANTTSLVSQSTYPAGNSTTLSSANDQSQTSISVSSAVSHSTSNPGSGNAGQSGPVLPGSPCIMSTSLASNSNPQTTNMPSTSDDTLNPSQLNNLYLRYKMGQRTPAQPTSSFPSIPAPLKTVIHPPPNNSSMPSPLVNALFGMNTPTFIQSSDPQSDIEEDQNILKMFFVSALVGRYTGGKKNLRKPPPLDCINAPYGKCYDSCVDDVFNPKIFVVFDTAQVYPEYLIEYKFTSPS